MKLPCRAFSRKNPQTSRYAHIKRDGLCMSIYQGAVLSTTGENYYRSLDWHPCFAAIRSLPRSEDWIMAAELFVEGEDHSQVKTHLNARSDKLRLEVFAIANVAWATAPLEEVKTIVENRLGLPFVPWIGGPSTQAESLALADAIPDELEGYVLKNANLVDWVKVKRDLTIDLIVTGFVPAKPGKFEGKVGGIICSSTEGHTICSTSGMPDSIRDRAESLLGSVIEVGYTAVGTRGRLIHPRFVRERPDKQHHECKVDQDPVLEAIWSH